MAIKLSKEEINDLVPSVQRYMREEFDEDIGSLKAKFLIAYFLEEIGPYAYNKGVRDAENYFREKITELPDICFEDGLTYWTKKKKKSPPPA